MFLPKGGVGPKSKSDLDSWRLGVPGGVGGGVLVLSHVVSLGRQTGLGPFQLLELLRKNGTFPVLTTCGWLTW